MNNNEITGRLLRQEEISGKLFLFYNVSGLFPQRCQDGGVQEKGEDALPTEEPGRVGSGSPAWGLDLGLPGHCWTVGQTERGLWIRRQHRSGSNFLFLMVVWRSDRRVILFVGNVWHVSSMLIAQHAR